MKKKTVAAPPARPARGGQNEQQDRRAHGCHANEATTRRLHPGLGRLAPVLEGKARIYRAPTWEEAIRAAGKGEGVSAAKIEDRITTVERARREGLTVYFAPMDG